MKTSIGRYAEIIIRAIKKKDKTGAGNAMFRHPDSIKNN